MRYPTSDRAEHMTLLCISDAAGNIQDGLAKLRKLHLRSTLPGGVEILTPAMKELDSAFRSLEGTYDKVLRMVNG